MSIEVSIRGKVLGVQLLASLLAVALLTPRFALLLCVFLAVYGFLADRGGRRCRDRADAAYAVSGDLSRSVGDVLTNAQRVVFNGALSFEDARFSEASGRRQAASTALARSVAELASLQFITLLIGQGLVLMLAASDVAAGRLSLGVFVLLQAFAFRLSAPLGGVGILLKDTVSALANLRDVLSLQASPLNSPQPVEDPIRHDMEAKDIGFTYDGGLTGLQAISAKLAPGAFVALVGPNGSGKSTFAIAKHRGWTIVTARGSAEFRREAWLAGRSIGLEVRGYRPTERDLQELQRRQDLRIRAEDRNEVQAERGDDRRNRASDQREVRRERWQDAGAKERLKVVEAVVRSLVVGPDRQERILAAARERTADWLERGATFEPFGIRRPPEPAVESTRMPQRSRGR